MKLPYSLLLEFVKTDLSAEQIGDALTMAGFELEEMLTVAGEPVLDVNIMANRGDGASIMGLAREVLACVPGSSPTDLYRCWTSADSIQAENIDIQTPLCDRFAARVFRNIQNGESPEWLKKRLELMGQRSISLLVDLTNYVMLEQGQPLHAYDMDLLRLPIVVRLAKEGEKLQTLDGVERTLQAHHLVIADQAQAVGIAGVMGGLATEVHEGTQNCFLESAHFDGPTVRRTRKELGLFTEASYRFERWVDPAGVESALNRFAELYFEITGIRAEPAVYAVGDGIAKVAAVRLGMARCARLLGMEVSNSEAQAILERLGFEVSVDGDDLIAQPPTWRSDIQREEDLIEEVGRIFGYDKIPEALPMGSTWIGGTEGLDALTDKLIEECLRCGLDQAVSHSMRDRHPLDGTAERVQIREPHSPELAWLRSSLLPGLAEAIQRNGSRDRAFFEAGRVFHADRELPMLAGLATGIQGGVHFASASSKADFWMIKGVVERLLDAANRAGAFVTSSLDQRFHPTRQALILVGDAAVGVVGQIHPDVASEETFGFEIDLPALMQAGTEDITAQPISRQPAARRDIAVLIPKLVPYAQIDSAVRTGGGAELERHWLFDIFEGAGIPEGHHSLAIALQLRRMDATFKDEEANLVRDAVVRELESLGAKLR